MILVYVFLALVLVIAVLWVRNEYKREEQRTRRRAEAEDAWINFLNKSKETVSNVQKMTPAKTQPPANFPGMKPPLSYNKVDADNDRKKETRSADDAAYFTAFNAAYSSDFGGDSGSSGGDCGGSDGGGGDGGGCD